MMSASIILQNAVLQSHLIWRCCYKRELYWKVLKGVILVFASIEKMEKDEFELFILLQCSLWNFRSLVKYLEYQILICTFKINIKPDSWLWRLECKLDIPLLLWFTTCRSATSFSLWLSIGFKGFNNNGKEILFLLYL